MTMKTSCLRPLLTILHGSQTGTATDVAKRIRRQAKSRRFPTELYAMNDFTTERLMTTNLIIFVASTTGQGEEPDNMKVFWRSLLRRRLPPNSLTNLEFAVLGLGDSSYQYFNFTSKRLHKRLLRLGAVALYQLGLADDQHELGFDGIAEPWIKGLFEALNEKFPLPAGVDEAAPVGPEPSFNVCLKDALEVPNVECSRLPVGPPYDAENPFHASVIANDRVTAAEHFQDVRLIKMDIAGSGFVYQPGDVMVVYPKNSLDQVEELLTLLHLEGNQVITLSLHDEDAALPLPCRLSNPCTIRQAATNLWDFQCVPRRSFFELLHHFAVNEREKERLKEFASPEGTDELYGYCYRPRRTAFEILQDFSDTRTRVPLEYWFDLFPPMQPRSFSIASSPLRHQTVLHILVAVVQYKTKLQKPRMGLCSNYLKRVQAGDSLDMWIKTGTMSFRAASERPVVMVGPGTGVAPFRSFIHDQAVRSHSGSILFFGCRNEDHDYYFREEWKELQEDGILVMMPPAFSRDQIEKVYVQDRMKAASQLVFEAVYEQEGLFYLAGNAKQMPADVTFALKRVLCENSKMSMDDADAYIQQMQKDGRYQTETWS
ncbi:NADPH-dependent diflavin oxidoreductase 1-like [Paramacrobiotus metropolitanus]|uniref:NADPH-dependent diflavin oxidoreductase 1-like n=1 Tax=Paramacrobiotus metropolitanus TaxID=2943436 RepID=UPI0024459B41|nr:NADPH-dependent diflavin oxidoreductase 1-like [Paramacrobiotus metropolitanus]